MTIIHNEAEWREFRLAHSLINPMLLNSDAMGLMPLHEGTPIDMPFGIIDTASGYIVIYPSEFPQPEPKIKKLEWEESCGRYIIPISYDWKANTRIHNYWIHHVFEEQYDLLIDGYGHGTFHTLEAAMQAAQEHYEELVKSCLINNGE